MLSQYPVLDNKPIDQWRVTELREELRKRSLATKGLKEELVKRLDEAIQKEKQSENEVELGNGVEPNSDLQNNINEEDVELEGAENTQPLLDVDDNTDNDASIVNINHGVVDVNQESTGRNGDAIEVAYFVGIDEENASTTDDVEGNVAVKKNVATPHSGMQGADAELEELKPPICGIFEEKEATTGDLEGIAPVNQNITAQSGMQDEDAEPEKFEEMKPPIAEADEENAVITGDFESSAPVSQDFTAQSGKQGEDAKPVDKFDESMPPIVETDEMAATTDEFEGSAPISQNITFQSGMQGEDAEPEEKFEDLKALTVDSTVIQSKQSNQVSEISQDLGFQVKYESNSTDSVSINEKNYIKDNLSADNFPLELEVVKQEVVQSSSNSYPTGGDSCMAVDEDEAAKYHAIAEQEGVKNEVSDEQEVGQNLLDEQEANDINVANGQYLLQNYDSCQQEVGKEPVSLKDANAQNASAVLPKKEDCVEAGSPEKLNLDRSSGDESMEEDVLESKHMEVDIKFAEPTNKIEVKKVDAKLEEKVSADAASKYSPEMKDVAVEDVKPAALTMKRKLGEADVGNNGAPKRHRRWNPDIIKVPEQQTPHLDIAMAPKNNTQTTPRHTFSRSNSALSVDSPKERIVPTPKKPATTSLRIDNFLRPFTLKAVQELLAQTGNVCDFWMDHIKTHCYVTYSSVEEAIETRNAVYNLQWPPNGGRLLAAEFVDPQEVKSRLEVPPQSPVATPKAPSPIQKTQAPQPTLQQNLRLQPLPPPPPLSHPPPPPPPLLSNPPPIAREQRLPPPPPKKPDPPVVTLDDLFKKTKATPRIYYLPLTEEQVAAKSAAQGKRKQV